MRVVQRKWVIFGAIALLVILIDQITKNWVLANMEVGETVLLIPALHPYFQLTRSWNTGIAFGFLAEYGEIFLFVSMAITVVIILYVRHAPPTAYLMQGALALVAGGALGNILDRMQHGAVVDFVHIRVPGLVSNVSNLADHAIVLGVFLLIVESLWRERSERRRQPASEEELSSLPPDHPTG